MPKASLNLARPELGSTPSFPGAESSTATGAGVGSGRKRRPMRVVHTEAIVHDRPSAKALVLGAGSRFAVKPLLSIAPLHEKMFRRVRAMERYKPRKPALDIATEVLDLDGVYAESMRLTDGPVNDLTTMYMHGGGFFSGSVSTHRSTCERLARHTGGTVISVDYTLIPHGTVADAVQDVMTAYTAILGRVSRPDQVVVAGDSAGGYLATKVAELSTRRKIQHPAGLIGFSPLLSIDPERQDKNVVRVTPMREVLLPIQQVAKIRELWLADEAVIEGFASPLHSSAYIRCPVHLVAVEAEMLRPEVEAFALLLSDKGVDVETHLWRGQIHAFTSFVDLLPEADVALQLASSFARRAVGEAELAAPTDDSAETDELVGELAS